MIYNSGLEVYTMVPHQLYKTMGGHRIHNRNTRWVGDCITIVATTGVLAAFPALRSIQLEVLHSDESDDEDSSTRACTQSFLRALKPANAGAAHDVDGGKTPGSSMRRDAVPCPDLRHLEISGEQLNDGTALLNLASCLSGRQRALGPDAPREGRLERLVLRIDDLHDEAHFLARRATFLKALSPLVDEVIYEEDDSDSEDFDSEDSD